MMTRERLRHIMRKEVIQIQRDRRIMVMLIVAPLFQLLMFGYAVTLDIKHVPLVVCDRTRSAESRELTDSFTRSEYFDLTARVDSPQQMDAYLTSGRSLLGLYVPRDFSKRRARGETAEVQIIIDGTDMNSARVAAGYAAGLISHHVMTEAALRPPRPVSQEPRIWYNPDLKSVNYMVPAVICMILGTVMTSLTALGLVREREAGTLEQLIVTPVRPLELILGKTLPFAVIGLVDVVLVVLLARYWFGVKAAGSLPLLFLSSAVFLLTTLGLGTFISTVSRTQQQAMLTAFFVIMPSVLLSGFMFPIENMPEAVQYLTYGIPLRYFVTILRGIYLKGVGMGVLWPQLAALAALGGAIFAISVARFQKRLD
jgi:ABC-2 type transport system permease protein